MAIAAHARPVLVRHPHHALTWQAIHRTPQIRINAHGRHARNARDQGPVYHKPVQKTLAVFAVQLIADQAIATEPEHVGISQ